MNEDWRPTVRPNAWQRIKSIFWAWLKQQARLRAFEDNWRSGL